MNLYLHGIGPDGVSEAEPRARGEGGAAVQLLAQRGGGASAVGKAGRPEADAKFVHRDLQVG